MITEEKAKVVSKLFEALKETDYCHDDLLDMYYTTSGAYTESVILEWACGQVQEVDVSFDSGIAIIKDVVNAIEL